MGETGRGSTMSGIMVQRHRCGGGGIAGAVCWERCGWKVSCGVWCVVCGSNRGVPAVQQEKHKIAFTILRFKPPRYGMQPPEIAGFNLPVVVIYTTFEPLFIQLLP
jgi:hypothetical protein